MPAIKFRTNDALVPVEEESAFTPAATAVAPVMEPPLPVKQEPQIAAVEPKEEKRGLKEKLMEGTGLPSFSALITSSAYSLLKSTLNPSSIAF